MPSRTIEEQIKDPKMVEIYVLGYITERSKASSRHKLPTRTEIQHLTMSNIFGPEVLVAALDRLFEQGRVQRDGPYYSTKPIGELPL